IVSATVVAEDGSPGELAPPKLTAGLFEGCAALTSVELPSELAEIGAEAFAGCGALVSVVLPPTVTAIGDRAFAWCGSLSEINVPEGTTLGEEAFVGCEKLKKE
ncbi:MAG: leucine-rich repeat domain-containing protein, partial [Bacteroidales bacterium]|nr:leucine-rich repeat domain-containing protein [Bacteroidales bacterium]